MKECSNLYLVFLIKPRQKNKEKQYLTTLLAKSERPKHSIYRHKLDYCDFCAKKKENLRRNQTTLNRIRQTGSADSEEQKTIEAEIAALTEKLEKHCENAKKSHDYYTEAKDRCKREWKEIESLEEKQERTEQEEDTLEMLKHTFTAVISVDYQMQKQVPHWSHSPQPGATYYLQKMSHDIFGIVDHSNDQSTLYIFDETVGPKNTDHTISLLMRYMNGERLPSCVKRWHIFLDNTGSTNKNAYFMGWGMEMIQNGSIDYLRFSFLVAGHTKFDVDRIFSVTAKAYNASDVFNTQELLAVMSQSDKISGAIVDGDSILSWRDKVSQKYSKLPGIRDLHDFLIIQNPTTNNAMMLVREFCHGGAAKPTTLSLNSGVSPEFNCCPGPNETYSELGQDKSTTVNKTWPPTANVYSSYNVHCS